MKYLILISVLLISTGLLAQIATAPTIGMGTLEDPFHIENFEHLYYITLDSGTWGMHFIQTQDIDASASALISDETPGHSGWLPIGRGSIQFTGSYNGQNYRILNLSENRPTQEFNGFFGFVDGASIQGVHLRDATINGGHYAGILCAVAHSGSIINHCSATGSVSGTYNVGGLVGFSNNSQIMNCYAQANAVGWDRVGGFIGTSGWQDQHTYISHCYSTGNASSTISGSVGGFSGWGGYGYHRDCYWNIDSSENSTSASATGKTNTEMMLQATFPLWNFNNLWTIDEGNGYPEIQAMSGFNQPAGINLSQLPGTGSMVDPYLISNADELNLIREDLDAYYKLDADIDLSSSVIWNFGQGWQPVGNSQAPFTGNLDGDFHKISGLTVNRARSDNLGLFGVTNSATISNLDLVDTYISGNDNCGAIAGSATLSTIASIVTKPTIVGHNAVGGITGVLSAGEITNCFADALLKSYAQYLGGISGITLDSNGIFPVIEECATIGIQHGAYNVGGIVGYHARGTISDCFSRAELSAVDQVGGITGTLGSNTVSAFIQRSYAANQLNFNSSAYRFGGVLGWHIGGTVTDCYWDTQSSGLSNSGTYSGATGLNSTQMSYPGSIEHFTGWDFTETWQHDSSLLQNDGYPYLYWQLAPVTGINLAELEGTIYLSWQAVPRVTSYRVYAADEPYAPRETWTYLGQTAETNFNLPAQGKKFFLLISLMD